MQCRGYVNNLKIKQDYASVEYSTIEIRYYHPARVRFYVTVSLYLPLLKYDIYGTIASTVENISSRCIRGTLKSGSVIP
jgi:hypothetical protein